MNQLSVRSAALISSVSISLMVFIILIFFDAIWWHDLIVILALGLINYYLITYIIKIYVNQRLKVVYRSIYNKSKEEQTQRGDAIDVANAAVEAWDDKKSSEMEQMRRSEVYRKEFVANVTHELKTPLFNIQGYIHSLLDGAIDDHEVNRIFLDKASRNIDRLASLVSDLEVITQLETGGAVFENEIFDINQLIEEVFESLEIKARARKKKFKLNSGEENFYVKADKEKIRQVFTNLIENSIKYGKENGYTWINLINADDNLLIEVCDDGPGIPNEHLIRLFERFYRVDKSRSRDAGGTGLGLAIVKHILEGHGKSINVRSEVGVGTVFNFSLEKK